DHDSVFPTARRGVCFSRHGGATRQLIGQEFFGRRGRYCFLGSRNRTGWRDGRGRLDHPDSWSGRSHQRRPPACLCFGPSLFFRFSFALDRGGFGAHTLMLSSILFSFAGPAFFFLTLLRRAKVGLFLL